MVDCGGNIGRLVVVVNKKMRCHHSFCAAFFYFITIVINQNVNTPFYHLMHVQPMNGF